MEYEALVTEEKLATEFKYKPLPPMFSLMYRQLYEENLPEGFETNGAACTVASSCGTPICFGYERIVIGDYGAFIEFSPEQANKDMFAVKPGEEYRIKDERFADRVKYHWLTVKDKSNIKIYFQQKTVSYADYKPGMYYVSPHECRVVPERLTVRINIANQKVCSVDFKSVKNDLFNDR